jgi:hypothetical protein
MALGFVSILKLCKYIHGFTFLWSGLSVNLKTRNRLRGLRKIDAD